MAPRQSTHRRVTWTEPTLFDQDEPHPIRDLLVEWAMGYSPADPDPYPDQD